MSPDRLSQDALGVMARALGATEGRLEGYRNSFVSSPQTQPVCDYSVASGWMAERFSGSSARVYQVTPAGKSLVRQHLLEKSLEELVQDRVHTIATEMASELVGPNSHEYDALVEQFEESDKVDASARKSLLGDAFALAMQQREAMISTYSAITKLLGEPESPADREAIKVQLREMQQQISVPEQGRALVAAYNLAAQAPAQAAAPAAPVNAGVALGPSKTMFLGSPSG